MAAEQRFLACCDSTIARSASVSFRRAVNDAFYTEASDYLAAEMLPSATPYRDQRQAALNICCS
jgi:hypothetical protein